MTKEQSLIRYIKHMSKGSFGYAERKDLRDYYIDLAKDLLRTLRVNKTNDPDRYNKLESERKEISQKVVNFNMSPEDAYNRCEEIDKELTTLWKVENNLPSIFNIQT